ncbi:MAG: polysaccharide biosynthesis/export family protein [Pseudomonadota bacterium]
MSMNGFYSTVLVRILALLTAGLLLAACNSATTPTQFGKAAPDGNIVQVGERSGNIRVVATLPPPDSAAQGEVRLSPSDLIEVDVFQVNDLDRTVKIGGGGFITMPLIGRVRAAGLTTDQLAQRIATAYGRNYLQNPQVTVFVKESAGQKITVDGEVKKPGVYDVNAQSTLSTSISFAGGLTKISDPTKVYVFRQIGKERQVANVSLTDIRQGKRNDIRIYGGDVIVVYSSSSRIAMQNLKDTLGVARGVRGVVPF